MTPQYGPVTKIPFGKSKNQDIVALPNQELESVIKYCQSINKFQDVANACQAELDKRGGLFAGVPPVVQPGYVPGPLAAPTQAYAINQTYPSPPMASQPFPSQHQQVPLVPQPATFQTPPVPRTVTDAAKEQLHIDCLRWAVEHLAPILSAGPTGCSPEAIAAMAATQFISRARERGW